MISLEYELVDGKFVVSDKAKVGLEDKHVWIYDVTTCPVNKFYAPVNEHSSEFTCEEGHDYYVEVVTHGSDCSVTDMHFSVRDGELIEVHPETEAEAQRIMTELIRNKQARHLDMFRMGRWLYGSIIERAMDDAMSDD